MPRRDVYEQDDGGATTSPFNVLKIIGNSRSLTSGFASWAIKTIAVTTVAGAVWGLTGYMMLSRTMGPVMPFMGGAAFGVVGGLVHRYNVDKEEALTALELYPDIMAYHVAQVEPSELKGTNFPEWATDAKRCMRKTGILITALYSAGDTLARIDTEREQRLIAALTAE